jgi:hypothetical protein
VGRALGTVRQLTHGQAMDKQWTKSEEWSPERM